MSKKAELDGVEAFAKAMGLKANAIRRLSRGAVKAAAKPIAAAAKSKAANETGLLKKAIGTRTRSYKSDQTELAVIGIKADVEGLGPDGRKRRPIKYAHLVEYGTIDQPPRPFMRPAFDSKKSEALGIIAEAMKQGLQA